MKTFSYNEQSARDFLVLCDQFQEILMKRNSKGQLVLKRAVYDAVVEFVDDAKHALKTAERSGVSPNTLVNPIQVSAVLWDALAEVVHTRGSLTIAFEQFLLGDGYDPIPGLAGSDQTMVRALGRARRFLRISKDFVNERRPRQSGRSKPGSQLKTMPVFDINQWRRAGSAA